MTTEIFDVDRQRLSFELISYKDDIYMEYEIENSELIKIHHSNYFYENDLFEFIENLENIRQYSDYVISITSVVNEEFTLHFSSPLDELIIEIGIVKYSVYQHAKNTVMNTTIVIPFEYKNSIIQNLKMLKNQILKLKQVEYSPSNRL